MLNSHFLFFVGLTNYEAIIIKIHALFWPELKRFSW